MKIILDGAVVTAPAGGAPLPTDVDGVFETIRVQSGLPEYWTDHWNRFIRGCEWFHIGFPLSSDGLQAIAASLIRENRIASGVLRYAAWNDDARLTWTMEAVQPRPSMDLRSMHLTLGPRLPAAGRERAFKILRRAAWNDALREARASGCDDAILTDSEDRIVETCVGNVFFELAGKLCAPGPGAGAMPGIMRGKVLEAARAAGVPVYEGDCFAEQLVEAREILVSNSLIGLLPARSLESRSLTTDGPLLARLRSSLRGRDA